MPVKVIGTLSDFWFMDVPAAPAAKGLRLKELGISLTVGSRLFHASAPVTVQGTDSSYLLATELTKRLGLVAGSRPSIAIDDVILGGTLTARRVSTQVVPVELKYLRFFGCDYVL
jgi:hypothetical protein